MNLDLRSELTSEYRSKSQIARVLTEDWVERNMFCPECGNINIEHFKNNRPVADFFCPVCQAQYELKSKNGQISKKITDGAYDTMIRRITSNSNPDFFFMSYSLDTFRVKDLVFIPKYFFVPDIIEKRKPLSSEARRSGWVGCNILIDKIPEQGRIFVIKSENIENRASVVEKMKKASLLRTRDLSARGWLMDILNCVNMVVSEEFGLSDIYYFEHMLAEKYPNNNNIKAKIRQQLQFLRNKGFIKFLGNGKYLKL